MTCPTAQTFVATANAFLRVAASATVVAYELDMDHSKRLNDLLKDGLPNMPRMP
jgi:hypothetical protein